MATRSDNTIVGENGSDIVNGIPTIDPNGIDNGSDTSNNSGSDSGNAPTKRGRKPRSDAGQPRNGTGRTGGNSSTNKTQNKSTIGIEQLLLSIHLMMAGATKIQEFAITEDESKQLAKALSNVSELYNVEIDPRIMVWVGFSSTVSQIYAPRIIAYKMRMKNEERKRKENEVQVTPLNQGI